MTQVMCRLGLLLFSTLAILTGQATTAAAQPNPTAERFEVSAVKAARPFLVDTIAAIQQGNVMQAKEASEAYDSAWNGIEVYIRADRASDHSVVIPQSKPKYVGQRG